MGISGLLTSLGGEIEDAYEEAFLLFSAPIPSQNLGFIDSKARSLELTVGSQDLVIHQSPSLLSSDRAGGTTGAAVVWKITPLFAEWLISEENILSKTSTVTSNSTVLELGCGISGVLALSMSPRVHRYVATDQEYVFKLLKQNLDSNTIHSSAPKVNAKPPTKRKDVAQLRDTTRASNIEILALDWESSDLSNLPGVLRSSTDEDPLVDVVLACDCIYNETLIEPFVRTCADLCRLSDSSSSSVERKRTVCAIAQQLRSDTVFETWLTFFMREFRVWRVSDTLLTQRLRSGQGFVVHVGILKEETGRI